MPYEIERKFLVVSDDFKKDATFSRCRQGYLANNQTPIVRVRVIDNSGFITIKGANRGITRSEFEYEIPLVEAEEMLNEFCSMRTIEKCRYKVPYEGYTWHVDVFFGLNEGLILAEIELPSEQAHFARPHWLGIEVSYDLSYYNCNLINNPFKSWT